MVGRRYRRRSARVILVDQEERILLFRDKPSTLERAWFTPGGGVDRFETLRRAAARELREETGLRVPPRALGKLVAYTSGYAELSWATGVFRDDLFFYRIGAHTVDTSGFTPLEQDTIGEHRWWPLAELAATPDRVIPYGLADLTTRLLGGWRPAVPEQLPWHH
jgi:8-oxo-dGTP pyrophosphatase MutT (NUDIX family)